MISCICIDDFGETSVGSARVVTCRMPRQCDDCGHAIDPGSFMYVQSMYSWADQRAVKPYYMCETCGDLIESLSELGYCFPFGGVLRQWREYQDMRKELR